MGIEVAHILNQVNPEQWTLISSEKELISFSDTAKALLMINYTNRSNLYGQFIFFKQKPIPWSWRKNRNNLFMLGKAIKLNLTKF